MDKFIKANPQNGLKYASKYYADDDHGSVPLASEYDGLRFIFSWYRFKFTRPTLRFQYRYCAKTEETLSKLSKEFGYNMSPPEMNVNGLAYNALSQKQYTKAERLFDMNVANYPESGNVYDSYADLLAAKKDTVNALSNYEKAYAITKSEETKQKMDQLQGNQPLNFQQRTRKICGSL